MWLQTMAHFVYGLHTDRHAYTYSHILAVLFHDARNDDKWNDDDVEIGRCLSRKVDTQCSSSAEVSVVFSNIDSPLPWVVAVLVARHLGILDLSV